MHHRLLACSAGLALLSAVGSGQLGSQLDPGQVSIAKPGARATSAVIKVPLNGSIVNDETPDVAVAFLGDQIDPDGVRVLLDGVEVQDELDVYPFGIGGELPEIVDGLHTLEVWPVGSTALLPTSVTFESSTGGGPTRVFGYLLDPEGEVPIVGADIYFDEGGPTVQTDASGYYEIVGGPIGSGVHINFDPVGLTFVERGSGEPYIYPAYKRPIDVYEASKNSVDVCYLPKVHRLVELGTLPEFDCGTSTFTSSFVLENTDIGVSLTIAAGTYLEFPSGDPCNEYLSIEPVDETKAPSNMPPGTDPVQLVTMQPTGLKFRDAPGGDIVRLPVTFQNTVGVDVGVQFGLLSVDHETGTFVEKGTVEAMPDGTFQTIEGGLEGGSWHSPIPRPPVGEGGDPDNGQCTEEVNPTADLGNGSIVETFPLPKRRLFDQPWGPDLVYSSRALQDYTILRSSADFGPATQYPFFVGVTLTPYGYGTPPGGGSAVSFDVTTVEDTPGIAKAVTMPVDISLWKPGAYEVAVGFYALVGQCETYCTLYTSDFAALSSCSFTFPPPFFDGGPVTCLDGNISFASTPAEEQPRIPLLVAAPADGTLGRGWRFSGDNLLVPAKTLAGSTTLHLPDGRVLRMGDSVLKSGNGLRARLFAGTSSTEVTSYFATSNALDITVRRNGQAPEVVDQAIVPNANFWNADGPYFLHAGADGVLQTSDPANPGGDDIVLEAPGGADTFGAVLDGSLLLEGAATVTFTAFVDDAVALEINGSTVLSLTGTNPQGFATSSPIALEAGAHEVRVAYADLGGLSHLNLYWSVEPGSGSMIVPEASCLLGGGDLPPAGNLFIGEGGEFSTLDKFPDGTYQRNLPDKGYETYDANGRITSRVTRHGRTTTYVRDVVDGRLLAIDDPVGGTYALAYSGDKITTITDPAGRVTTLSYSGEDLTTITDAANNDWGFTYGSSGLLTSATDAEQNTNSYQYDALGRFTKTTYSDMSEKTIEYEDAADSYFPKPKKGYPFYAGSGVRVTVTDEAGNPTVHETNIAGRWHRATDALGRQTLVWMSSLGLPIRTERRSSEGEALVVFATNWDEERGLPTSVINFGDLTDPDDDRHTEYTWHPTYAWRTGSTVAEGSGVDAVETLVFDAQTGDVLSRTDAASEVWIYTYGSLGVLESATDPTGITISLTADGPTQSLASVSHGGSVYSFGRDARGDMVSMTLPDGVSTAQYVRDALGRVTETTDAQSGVWSYSYDGRGLLTSVRDAKAVFGERSYAYDGRGWLVTATDALGEETEYVRSAVGEVLSLEVDGLIASQGYDAVGRLVSVTVGPETETFGYDDLDRLTSVETAWSRVERDYSAFGELVTEREELASPTSEVHYSYDERSRIVSRTVAVAGAPVSSTSYSYSDRDAPTLMVETVNDSALPASTATYSFSYDGAGRRTLMGRGALETVYGYDLAKWGILSGTTTTRSGAQIAQDDLTLNANLDVDAHGQERTLLPDDTCTVPHDSLLRVLSASYASLSPGTYAPYDPVGNRRTDVSSYDKADRLVQDASYFYDYDARGNLVRRRTTPAANPARVFEYDFRNRLVAVKDVAGDGTETLLTSYTYDAVGRRLSKDGARYVFASEDVVYAIGTGGDRCVVTHGPGFDEPVALHQASGSLDFVHDARGDVVLVVGASGVVAERRYDPFGQILTEAGSWPGAAVDFTSRGRRWDSETGLIHNRARALDPTTGRFLQREPKYAELIRPAVPQYNHPYALAMNAPYRLSDPSGLEGGYWDKVWDNYNDTNDAIGDAFGSVADSILPDEFGDASDNFVGGQISGGLLGTAAGAAEGGFAIGISLPGIGFVGWLTNGALAGAAFQGGVLAGSCIAAAFD